MSSASIILASGSKYRRQLIDKLRFNYRCHSPDIDESPLLNESARQLVERLATNKALALKDQYPEHLIIGSDQVAVRRNQIITKPGSHLAAKQQLQLASGQEIEFLTGLCLFNSLTGRTQYRLAVSKVKFRTLSQEQIEAYLDIEQPYDCAGSFKSEALGIALLEYIHSDDPNSLIGLSLIDLVDMLLEEGVRVP